MHHGYCLGDKMQAFFGLFWPFSGGFPQFPPSEDSSLCRKPRESNNFSVWSYVGPWFGEGSPQFAVRCFRPSHSSLQMPTSPTVQAKSCTPRMKNGVTYVTLFKTWNRLPKLLKTTNNIFANLDSCTCLHRDLILCALAQLSFNLETRLLLSTLSQVGRGGCHMAVWWCRW